MAMATFVIIPGACTPPVMFQDFCNFAKGQGVAVVAVQLATVCRTRDQPAPGISDDVQAIRQVVEPLLDYGKEVILVTSSLGGVPGTQCLEFLSITARSSHGRKGGVEKIIYVTSMILEPNTSALDFFGPDPPPIFKSNGGDQYIEWTDEIEDGTQTFSDLPEEEARKHRAKMARFNSRLSFENKLTYPGYKYVQVHYVICEEDRIVPKEAQLALIEILKRHAVGNVTIHRISSGHLPFVSRPEDTLQILRAVSGG
ncbi:Alpha/beta hydrolase fold-1 [Ilyonectria destructans]|nr:Alpha/beta hydrolase fold-1 [Ilyonectria destructans]